MDRRKGRRVKRRDPALERRIDALVQDNGLSRAVATQVALGRVELNDILRKMALNAEVEGIIRKHDLSRALATQVALGQAELDAVLFKRAQAEYFESTGLRSLLTDAETSGEPVALALHGNRNIEALVKKVDQYEFDIEVGGVPERLHKLQVKWGARAEDRKKVGRSLGWDKALKGAVTEPVGRPQDRYGCSNRRIYGYMDRGTTVVVRLVEGEIFKGQVSWVSRFEFGLTVKGKVDAVIFRHAMIHIGEA